MKIANQSGRIVLVFGERIADVHDASGGRFGPDPMDAFSDWPAFVEFARDVAGGAEPLVEGDLGPPVPAPRQVFAIGLNYRSHARESGMAVPDFPAVFTKFPASLSGPFDPVELAGDTVDWEAELVAVIGRLADRVDEAHAWSHVAGLTVGQDISDRTLQFAAGSQFSLGKSRRTYGPVGPWLVTPDELDDPDDVALGCSIDGEVLQSARTSDLVFGVPKLITELSAVLPLFPGDVLFTGTPAGIGATREPPRFLQAGQVLETWVEGIGTMRNPCA